MKSKAVVGFVLALAVAVFCLIRAARLPRRPNVLLVTLDTLRADRLGCYGYSKARTPHLDELASEGVRFAQAFAQVSLTLPSHTTLFTGTYPVRHTVRDNGGLLKADLKTLAEVAAERGYRTAAFVSAFVLDSKWGLDRGFETYFDQFDLARYERVSLGSVQRVAGETVEELLRWLETPASRLRAPFFAWIHLYDPHAPYEAPEPFDGQFQGSPYDGEVAYTDAAVGRILGFLAAKGLDRTTVVVVAGDHGEGLGEHEELTHGNFVYDSTLRVPLLMRFPGRRAAGKVVHDEVGLIDLFPTLVEVLGAAIPAQNQGQSLLPLLEGGKLDVRPLLAESLYPRLHYGWSEVVAVRMRGFKYIDTPRPELFDLVADPGEVQNVVSQKPTLARQMKATLDERVPDAAGVSEPSPTDADAERRLRALGYIGAAARTGRKNRMELPDPKDKIHLIHAIARADALEAEGNLDEAIYLLRQVLDQDPTIIDAHLSLGNKLTEAGRWDEAILAFRRSLELNPEYDLALTNLALAYKKAGKLDDAELGFLRILERDPQNRQALFNLGEIRLLKKDYGKARELFEKGLALEGDSPIFLRQTGIAEYYLGNLARAESRLSDALAHSADVDSAHFTLALLYEKQRQWVKAESEYLAERKIHPQHLRSAFNLARLYGEQGRHREQLEALEEVVRIDPSWAVGFFHLAKAYRDARRPELDEKALEAAARGLALDRENPYAALGYFIRAEILERAGRAEEARRELARGKAIEGRARELPR